MAYDRKSVTGSDVSEQATDIGMPDLGQFEQPMGNAAMQEQLESQSGSGEEWEFGPIVGRGRVTTGGRSGGGLGGRRRVPSGTGSKRRG
jgi:hypothetical protein